MTSVAKKIADNASFQAFLNAYLKEIDSGVWHTKEAWIIRTGIPLKTKEHSAVELYLSSINTRLSIAATYKSYVGRHTFTSVFKQRPNSFAWEPISNINAAILLIDEIYQSGRSDGTSPEKNIEHKLELYARTIESFQVMATYLGSRLDDTSLKKNTFIDSEQSVLFGHWLHPTPKSRQGMHKWQHALYTPELKGRFKLHYFAAAPEIALSNSTATQTAFQILEDILVGDGTDESAAALAAVKERGLRLLAVHPLQASWLKNTDTVQALMSDEKLIELGEIGPLFSATSSVRTVYNETLDYMVKLSIPVKVTNSLRKNMRHELEAGVTLCRLLTRMGFSDIYPKFKFINDPAYISIDTHAQEESGFELILRENPFKANGKGEVKAGTASIAAIVQAPLSDKYHSRLFDIIESLSIKQGISKRDIALTWFEKYFECAIEPAIRLFDQCGIALEAHQQNSLLNIADGYPTAYYYRDNQGFYLSQERKDILMAMEPALEHSMDLFYSEQMIIDRFTYYLFFNQLFSVINRFGADGIINEEALLRITYERLTAMLNTMGALGARFVNALLHREKLPFKANLLTRVEDVDELEAENELAVYVWTTNPFLRFNNLLENDEQRVCDSKIKHHQSKEANPPFNAEQNKHMSQQHIASAPMNRGGLVDAV